MPGRELTPEDERWLEDYLASLPTAFGFDFEKATVSLIEDQGIEWVRRNAEMLQSQAEYIATL